MVKLLRSYSFGTFHGVDNIPSDILGLFSGLVENREKKIQYASEIIENGLEGRINLNRKFNIDAYEAKINQNLGLSKSSKGKKELFLDFGSGSDDYDDTLRKGGINLESTKETALIAMEEAYNELLDNDELEYAIQTIESLQQTLFIDEQVDFIGLMEKAIDCVPSAINKVKEICSSYPIVAEQVEIILNSGHSFKECFSSY